MVIIIQAFHFRKHRNHVTQRIYLESTPWRATLKIHDKPRVCTSVYLALLDCDTNCICSPCLFIGDIVQWHWCSEYGNSCGQNMQRLKKRLNGLKLWEDLSPKAPTCPHITITWAPIRGGTWQYIKRHNILSVFEYGIKKWFQLIGKSCGQCTTCLWHVVSSNQGHFQANNKKRIIPVSWRIHFHKKKKLVLLTVSHFKDTQFT